MDDGLKKVEQARKIIDTVMMTATGKQIAGRVYLDTAAASGTIEAPDR